ncbi:unnamed protein product [Durusdinium trenchii]|uniref:Uncharacterized protein n=1 Tax=Durusdinium trenchii TaxID=1381693 RepID=A0ABP0PZ24_9DINO
MNDKFTPEIAEAMRERKRLDPELARTEIRFHPECPPQEEYQQFLCLVEDAQESEHCEEIDRLYRCLDGDTDLLSDGDTAISDASSKIKWGLDLLSANLDNLSEKRATLQKEVDNDKASFSAKSLERESYGYYLNAKGYNSRVIAEWLLRKVIDVNRSDQFRDPYAGILASLNAASANCGMAAASAKHSRTGSQQQAQSIYDAGWEFLKAYRALNVLSISSGRLAWIMVPKWHALNNVLSQSIGILSKVSTQDLSILSVMSRQWAC